ncbi:MAG: L,D-transpeptidase family protein [Anaerolineae bacterium]|nr:L,D-transpeptidase family protein [Anaerolineae bacterium]
MNASAVYPSTNPPQRYRAVAGFLILVLFLILVASIVFSGWVFMQRMERLYRDHIYPNIYALGVNLGGLRPESAVSALDEVAANVEAGILVLTDGEQQWTYTWTEAGMYVDTQAMVTDARAIGRTEDWRAQAEVWLQYHTVALRFGFDAEAARGLLESLSTEVSQPAIDATIRLENGEIVVVPGQAGRMLNVSNTLVRLQSASGDPRRVEVPLEFEIVEPVTPDTESVVAQAEPLLARVITLYTYDVLTAEKLTWVLDRDDIAPWLHLVPGSEGEPVVTVNLYEIQATLLALDEEMGEDQGFRIDEASQQVFDAFNAEEESVALYLTHPERTYIVQAGDTLTSLAAKFGMPPGLVAAANTDIDIDRLSVGQQVIIPSQDVLTPHIPVEGKKIVINLNEQRMRVYENETLRWDWIVSTGMKNSPTHRGIFQIYEKDENAYGSQWDLWMPYFMAIYPAGGGVDNGIHELPILSSGQRLWAGNLGTPASYGCVILGIPDAETLFAWAEIGVIVVVE